MSDQPDASGERRSASRVACQAMVRYRRFRRGSSWLASPFKDVSRGGARFVSEAAFRPGELLEVSVGMPLFHDPVPLAARVVWQRTMFSGALQLSEHGVRFVSLATELQQITDEAIEQIGFESRGLLGSRSHPRRSHDAQTYGAQRPSVAG